jgi:DNA-binding NarL/FixJ family response regulator
VKADYLGRLDDIRPSLSAEDKELLASVVDGLTDAEIAHETGLDEESLHERVAALIERTL